MSKLTRGPSARPSSTRPSAGPSAGHSAPKMTSAERAAKAGEAIGQVLDRYGCVLQVRLSTTAVSSPGEQVRWPDVIPEIAVTAIESYVDEAEHVASETSTDSVTDES